MVKHSSSDCKCKFNSTTCSSNQKWNNDSYQCKYKKYHVCKKGLILNPGTCICKNDKYLKVLLIFQ